MNREKNIFVDEKKKQRECLIIFIPEKRKQAKEITDELKKMVSKLGNDNR